MPCWMRSQLLKQNLLHLTFVDQFSLWFHHQTEVLRREEQ
jgi:hypothetical protein